MALLRADTDLVNLVGDRIEPHSIGSWAFPALVYTDVPVSDDGIVRADRFEVHIIAKSIDDREVVDRRVRQLLLTLGDEPLCPAVLQVAINGGGTMEDMGTDTYHKITNYIVTSRSDYHD